MSKKTNQPADGEQLKRAMDKSEKEQVKAKEPKKPRETVDPEKFRASVASVVLQELEMWPEEIQELIGEDHPSEEAFMKGVPWVIGAYMHIVRTNLDRRVKEDIRKVGVTTAKDMSPAARIVHKLEEEWICAKKEAEAQLEADEAEEIKNAVTLIREKYKRERQKLKQAPVPEGLVAANEEVKMIEQSYEGEVAAIRSTADITLQTVKEIEDGAGNWNSKGRKARRKAHKETKKAAREAAEEARKIAKAAEAAEEAPAEKADGAAQEQV